MPQSLNRLGIGSLLCCAVVCVFILVLVQVHNRANPHISYWAGEYLWIVAPYVAVAIVTAISWRSRFWSAWVFASVIFVTVTNLAVYDLVYVTLGGVEGDAATSFLGDPWTLFVGPVITWNELGAFLLLALVVRVLQSLRQRS